MGGNLDQSSRVQAVVDYFGPTDFLQMDAHRLNGRHGPRRAESPESELIGGAIQENKEKVARANPITYVTQTIRPFSSATATRTRWCRITRACCSKRRSRRPACRCDSSRSRAACTAATPRAKGFDQALAFLVERLKP